MRAEEHQWKQKREAPNGVLRWAKESLEVECPGEPWQAEHTIPTSAQCRLAISLSAGEESKEGQAEQAE